MDLAKLRNQIDDIDGQLVALIGQRFAVTRQVGKYKKEHNLQSVDPEREAKQFERLAALAKEHDVSPELVANVMRTIINEVVVEHRRIASQN